MKEQASIRLYENPAAAEAYTGPYKADDAESWDTERGQTLPLTDEHGGRVFGIVDHIDPQTHQDDHGHRYKIVTVWIQD